MAVTSVFRFAYPGGDRLHAAVGGPRYTGCGRKTAEAQVVAAFPPAGILCQTCANVFGHRAYHAVDQGVVLPPLPAARVPGADAPVTIFAVNGVEGPSLYINSYRVAGNKPWGGGHDMIEWSTTWGALAAALGGQGALANQGAQFILSVGPAAFAVNDRTVSATLTKTLGYNAHAWVTSMRDILVAVGLLSR